MIDNKEQDWEAGIKQWADSLACFVKFFVTCYRMKGVCGGGCGGGFYTHGSQRRGA